MQASPVNSRPGCEAIRPAPKTPQAIERRALASFGSQELIASEKGRKVFQQIEKKARHFDVPTLVCINKFDVNEDLAKMIEEQAKRLRVATVGRIPYDNVVVTAQLAQRTVVEYSSGRVSAAMREVWRRMKTELDST